MTQIRNYIYYALIFIISLVALVFFPMIGTSGDLSLAFPTTVGGWILYCTKNGLTAVLNVIIFYSFLQQGELNSRDNEKYKEANDILSRLHNKEFEPKSPARWKAKQYTTKGVTIFFSTLTSAVALTNALLVYDYMSLITYVVVIVMGVVFGIISMKNAEAYWQDEFWQYAMRQKDLESKQVGKAALNHCLSNFDANAGRYIRQEEINKCLESITSNTETSKNRS